MRVSNDLWHFLNFLQKVIDRTSSFIVTIGFNTKITNKCPKGKMFDVCYEFHLYLKLSNSNLLNSIKPRIRFSLKFCFGSWLTYSVSSFQYNKALQNWTRGHCKYVLRNSRNFDVIVRVISFLISLLSISWTLIG